MHARADDIVARANEYVDVPWRHQGRSMELGVDCAGLLVCVAADLGISMFEWLDTASYSRRPDPRQFRQAMLAAGCTPRTHPEHGDMLRMAEPRWPVHVGIYEMDALDVGWVIHAYAPAKKVVREHMTTERWHTVREAMRFPE